MRKFNKFEGVQKYIKDLCTLSINAIIVYILITKNEIEKREDCGSLLVYSRLCHS